MLIYFSERLVVAFSSSILINLLIGKAATRSSLIFV